MDPLGILGLPAQQLSQYPVALWIKQHAVPAWCSSLAEPTSPKAVSVQSTDGLCKRYVREHPGHPGKVIDVVKVVHVDCSEKQ